MACNPDRHRRRSIRLKGYDYSRAGAYFVTVCTQNRECLFGEVVGMEMVLNGAGRMVQTVWEDMGVYYSGVKTDEFVVMPNHVHGIIVLVGATPRGRPDSLNRTDAGDGIHSGQAQGPAPTLSAPDVVHRFKTLTTKRYADGVKQSGWPTFSGRLWQRNYYEHIIRDEASLDRIREYIVNNPAQWALDWENPNFVGARCNAALAKDEPWRI